MEPKKIWPALLFFFVVVDDNDSSGSNDHEYDKYHDIRQGDPSHNDIGFYLEAPGFNTVRDTD